MRPLTYKTNWLLWVALSLICFLFYFDGREFVLTLFSGQWHIINVLTDFDFIGSACLSVLAGWLLQCVIVIVWSWRSKKAKSPR
jgi:hypothetical protein